MIVFCAKVKKKPKNFEFYFWNVKYKILGSIAGVPNPQAVDC